jgi:hypothetical protein
MTSKLGGGQNPQDKSIGRLIIGWMVSGIEVA